MELALKKYKDDVRDASVSALNKMAAKIKTSISAEVRQKYNLQKRYLDPLLPVKKANRNDLTVEIKAKTKKIGLDHFGKPAQGVRGVRVEIKRGRPVEIRVPGKENSIGTFIGARKKGAEIGAGPDMIFARKTKKAYPLRRVVGPSAADLGNTKDVAAMVKKANETEFPKLLDHEIQFYSKR